jgi:hypothetical protein
MGCAGLKRQADVEAQARHVGYYTGHQPDRAFVMGQPKAWPFSKKTDKYYIIFQTRVHKFRFTLSDKFKCQTNTGRLF